MSEATTAVGNIGTLVTGRVDDPLAEGTAVLVRGNRIAALGTDADLPGWAADTVIDAAGAVLAPGLIDCHAHPVFGDWTPRLNLSGYLEWAIQGGVTSLISAGEVHLPGRPTDPAGVKALAILAHKSFETFRPHGIKVHGGAVLLEPGLKEADFQEMAAEGVWLVGEIGLGGLHDPVEAAEMARWAQAAGMKVMFHAGGISAPTGTSTTAAGIKTVRPDVISHINGGSTPMLDADIDEIILNTDFVMDIVLVGNPRVRNHVVGLLQSRDELRRGLLGVDAPGGAGAFTLGMLRNVMEVSALGGIPAAQALAMASGNTADVYGLETGKIEVGRLADLVFLQAPLGSPANSALEALERGDMPGIAGVMSDGVLRLAQSRLTPIPKAVIVSAGA